MENNVLLDKWASYQELEAWDNMSDREYANAARDNIFGKKARARRQAKKSAKEEAKELGLSRKEVRLAGRQAKKSVKASQGAGIFGGKLAARKAAKSGGKLTALRSGATLKDARTAGRIAKQEVIATQKEAKAEKALSKGKEGKAERLKQKAVKLRSLKGKSRAAAAAQAAVLAPLLPLRGKMESMLRKRGKTIPPRMEQLAKVFYNEIIVPGRKGQYDEQPYVSFDRLRYTDSIEPVTMTIIATIVTAIVQFFKSSKEKVDKGEPVSNVEMDAAKALTIVEAKIEAQAKDEAAREVGEKILFDQKTWLVIGGIIVGIIILARRVK